MTDIHPVADAVRDFYLRAHRTLDRLMTQEGASLARMKLLSFFEREQGARSADVATAFGYAPRTVTEAIDALERDGLVQRVPDPLDRRAKRVTITEAGRQAMAKVDPIRQHFAEHVYGVLDDDEQAALVRIMRKLNGQLDV